MASDPYPIASQRDDALNLKPSETELETHPSHRHKCVSEDDAKLRPTAKSPARRGYYPSCEMRKYTVKSIT